MTKNVGGIEYPCHPSDPTRWSAFPVGFRGCYYCGNTDHGFSRCPKKSASGASTVFHWNLHCRKPEVWFKHKDHRQGNSGLSTSGSVRFSSPTADRVSSGTGAGLGRGRSAVMPAWVQRSGSNTIIAAPEHINEEEQTYDKYFSQDTDIGKSFV